MMASRPDRPDRAEPTEPTEPTDPTNPTKPSDPCAPTEPTDPRDPTYLTNATRRARPTRLNSTSLFSMGIRELCKKFPQTVVRSVVPAWYPRGTWWKIGGTLGTQIQFGPITRRVFQTRLRGEVSFL